jgi:ABC-type lipoprotein release transport system permease subunit
MKLFLILAWRNLWRNKQRTLITMGSVFFAVILVLFTRSMQHGTYNHMIENTVRLSTGYLQVQHQDFREKQSLEQSFTYSDSLVRIVDAIEQTTLAVPRIESFALVSSGDKSSGAAVIGIDPDRENEMNGLKQLIDSGAYLQQGGRGALVPAGLAERLAVGVGDTLVMISQGYHGVSAAGAYPVSGILDLPNPDMNRGVVYLPLSEAQWFYGMHDRITSLAVMIGHPRELDHVAETLQQRLAAPFTVVTWRELMPELLQAIQVDNAGGLIMLAILYVVIGFGMFGTVMMMAAERKREFSVLSAVGTKKKVLSMSVALETVTIAALGTLIGVGVSLPVLLYMHANPIELTGNAAAMMAEYGYQPLIPFALDVSLFVTQSLVVFGIALLASAYPIYWITRIRIADALRA